MLFHVEVGNAVGVAVLVGVAVGVGVSAGVDVLVGVLVAVGVFVAVRVGVGVGPPGVHVAVGVHVLVGVLVAVGVRVSVAVDVGVLVRVGVAVGVLVTVGVGALVGPPGVTVAVGVGAPLLTSMYASIAGIIRLPLTACPLLCAVSSEPRIRFQPVPTLTVFATVSELIHTLPLSNSRHITWSASSDQSRATISLTVSLVVVDRPTSVGQPSHPVADNVLALTPLALTPHSSHHTG